MKLVYKTELSETLFLLAEMLYEMKKLSREEFQKAINKYLVNKIIVDNDYFKNVIHEDEELEDE